MRQFGCSRTDYDGERDCATPWMICTTPLFAELLWRVTPGGGSWADLEVVACRTASFSLPRLTSAFDARATSKSSVEPIAFVRSRYSAAL